MKNFILYFAFICCIIPLTLHCDSDLLDKQSQPYQENLIYKYLRSIIPGVMVGSAAGTVTAIFDSYFPRLWPFSWFVCLYERTLIVDQISHDMKEKKLAHHKPFMELAALISAWLVYYRVYSNIK